MAKKFNDSFKVATGASLRSFGACANFRRQTIQDLVVRSTVVSGPKRDSKGRFIKV